MRDRGYMLHDVWDMAERMPSEDPGVLILTAARLEAWEVS